MTRPKISSFLFLAAGWILLSSLMALSAWGAIGGTITGATATRTGAFDATAPETATSVTTNVSYITSSTIIDNAKTSFASYNFVYAGQGVAAAIANIPDSCFTIAQYAPWVVDSNATTNFVSGPDQTSGTNNKHYRSVTGEDAGGANIVINYNPRASSTDPTDINFLQAYSISTNGGAFGGGTMDNGGSGGPFYNEGGLSGTGTTDRTGTIPLVSSSTTAAWLVDIPYTPEKGYSPPFADDTINAETDRFVTFISGQKVISGTTYNVLYGGISWGYTFTTVDIPEPATLVLLIPATLFGCTRRRRRMA